jgi:hypothetical protein
LRDWVKQQRALSRSKPGDNYSNNNDNHTAWRTPPRNLGVTLASERKAQASGADLHPRVSVPQRLIKCVPAPHRLARG